MTNFMDISLYPEQHLNKKRIIMTLFQYGFNYPTKPPPHLSTEGVFYDMTFKLATCYFTTNSRCTTFSLSPNNCTK